MRGSGLARYDFTVFVWLSASSAALAEEALGETGAEHRTQRPDGSFTKGPLCAH